MSYGQGGPQRGPYGSQTPDWSALAADAERKRNRKRWLAIGGSVLTAAAIGTVVALAIVNQSDGGDSTSGGPSTLPDAPDRQADTPRPDATFDDVELPPLPKPEEFIADPDKDTAPFEPDTFYAGDTMTVAGREYTEVATGTDEDCSAGANAELGAVLADHGCVVLLRATYVHEGVAVTVGVAQFPTEADAEAVRDAAVPHLLPLVAGDAPAFCQAGGCRTTANQAGRYAYFTIAGNSDGTPDSGDGTPARQAARDGNDHAFGRIIRRGEDQASAAADAIVEERERRQRDGG